LCLVVCVARGKESSAESSCRQPKGEKEKKTKTSKAKQK